MPVTNLRALADALLSGDKWRAEGDDARALAEAILTKDKWSAPEGPRRDFADAVISGDKWRAPEGELRDLADALISKDKWKAPAGDLREYAAAMFDGDKWNAPERRSHASGGGGTGGSSAAASGGSSGWAGTIAFFAGAIALLFVLAALMATWPAWLGAFLLAPLGAYLQYRSADPASPPDVLITRHASGLQPRLKLAGPSITWVVLVLLFAFRNGTGNNGTWEILLILGVLTACLFAAEAIARWWFGRLVRRRGR